MSSWPAIILGRWVSRAVKAEAGRDLVWSGIIFLNGQQRRRGPAWGWHVA